MPFISHSEDYRYPLERSCTTCPRHEECEAKARRDYRFTWLDPGRVGCRSYAGPYVTPKDEQHDPPGAVR